MSNETRSPSYPQMSLGKALDLADRLYRGIHRASVGNAEAQQIMGYSPKSGSALAALSALKRFGILEGRDPQIRLTPLALQILEPADPRERADGIAEAARKPELFAEVLDSFGGRLPADSAIRAKLVRDKNFTAAGADGFIRSFKETFSFAEREAASFRVYEEEYAEENSPDPALPSLGAAAPSSAVSPNTPTPVAPAGETMGLRVSPTTNVVITFSGPVTRSDVVKLSKLLEVLSDGYPEGV